MEYTKICKDPRCRKSFTTTSRNQGFCCKACQERYYKERTKRRAKYNRTKEENAIASAAYRTANLIADLLMPEKVCCKCGNTSTHVHHIDINPLNNDPANLVRMCESCHKKVHSELPNVNLIDCLNMAKETSANFDDIVVNKMGGKDPKTLFKKFMED